MIQIDMPMPDSCYECRFETARGFCKAMPDNSCGYTNYERRPEWCPLKDQEPRILDWDEIRNYPVVYGEFKGIKDIYPLIITVDSWGRCLSWNPGINVSKEFLLVVSDEEDRKNTRCWDKMPTDEQRQAVKWE